jgi:superfamily II DNA helicase RecQ
MSEWKNFRSEYYNLGILRARLSNEIFFLRASATLKRKTLLDVKNRCGFDVNCQTIKTALDRPEIYLQINQLNHSMNSMLDLQFILPVNVKTVIDVSKTIIFMNTIAFIRIAWLLIKKWMKLLNYPQISSTWVSSYFVDMASTDKERIGSCFAREFSKCNGLRILIVTDAYDLGIDNSNIQLVVQWLTLSTMTRLYQRLGRAMRCDGGQGNFVLLHAPWCVGSWAEPNESKKEKKSVKEKNADRRREMNSDIWELINLTSDQCARKIELRYFDDEEHKKTDWVKPPRCCHVCDSDFRLCIDSSEALSKYAERDSLRRPWYDKKFEEWRNRKTQVTFAESKMQYVSSLIMSNEIMKSLTTWAEYIHDEAIMRKWVSDDWPNIKWHWRELLNIIKDDQGMKSSRGEIFQVWKEKTDIKVKRVVMLIENSVREEVENRREKWIQSRIAKKDSSQKNWVKKNKGEKRKKNQEKQTTREETGARWSSSSILSWQIKSRRATLIDEHLIHFVKHKRREREASQSVAEQYILLLRERRHVVVQCLRVWLEDILRVVLQNVAE